MGARHGGLPEAPASRSPLRGSRSPAHQHGNAFILNYKDKEKGSQGSFLEYRTFQIQELEAQPPNPRFGAISYSSPIGANKFQVPGSRFQVPGSKLPSSRSRDAGAPTVNSVYSLGAPILGALSKDLDPALELLAPSFGAFSSKLQVA